MSTGPGRRKVLKSGRAIRNEVWIIYPPALVEIQVNWSDKTWKRGEVILKLTLILFMSSSHIWRKEETVKTLNLYLEDCTLFYVLWNVRHKIIMDNDILVCSTNDLGRKKFVVVYIISWACKQQSRYNNVGEGSKMVIQTQICDDDHNPKSAMYLPTNYNWCGKRIFARLLRSLSVNSQEWTCHM